MIVIELALMAEMTGMKGQHLMILHLSLQLLVQKFHLSLTPVKVLSSSICGKFNVAMRGKGLHPQKTGT